MSTITPKGRQLQRAIGGKLGRAGHSPPVGPDGYDLNNFARDLSLLARHAVTVNRNAEVQCSGAPEYALQGLSHPARSHVQNAWVKRAAETETRLLACMQRHADRIPHVNGKGWEVYMDSLHPVLLCRGLHSQWSTTSGGPLVEGHAICAAFSLFPGGGS